MSVFTLESLITQGVKTYTEGKETVVIVSSLKKVHKNVDLNKADILTRLDDKGKEFEVIRVSDIRLKSETEKSVEEIEVETLVVPEESKNIVVEDAEVVEVEKSTENPLDAEIHTLIAQGEKGTYVNDLKSALDKNDTSKEVAIKRYKKWIEGKAKKASQK